MLAFLLSVKQRRCPKTRARPITHYHAYRKYTECLYITDTSVFRTRSAAVVLATVLATNNIRVFTIYVIIASFYIFYASSVALTILLLKKPSNWSRIWTRIYYNNTFKRLPSVIFVFKQFLIGLKQNLREEDNLSTRDKWPVPKVSSFRRFYCKHKVVRLWLSEQVFPDPIHGGHKPLAEPAEMKDMSLHNHPI